MACIKRTVSNIDSSMPWTSSRFCMSRCGLPYRSIQHTLLCDDASIILFAFRFCHGVNCDMNVRNMCDSLHSNDVSQARSHSNPSFGGTNITSILLLLLPYFSSNNGCNSSTSSSVNLGKNSFVHHFVVSTSVTLSFPLP